MPPSLTSLTDEALIALETLGERAGSVFSPTLRLGVTGLSRAGKTIFITSLVHNLLHGGRLPMFEAAWSGRLSRAYLQPQPDDAVPRFQYEDHIARLVGDRLWPDSTRAISELRLVIEYESASGWGQFFSAGKLNLDIVDYPGEWLLDLPLLAQDYREFSRRAVELARSTARSDISSKWLNAASSIDPSAPASEETAQRLSRHFTDYLAACKADSRALSTLPPGRFLMPGDLDGSPALTFAPLPDLEDQRAQTGSLQAMMERRFESYKNVVIKPFFREHVTRLDRQIVLIDAMQAMNAGRDAVMDLERALADVLDCFRPGRTNPLTRLFAHRIDKVLVGATKADHLHHESHDRLEALVARLVERAAARIGSAGAEFEVMALAAVRATREATTQSDGETLPLIVGTLLDGETIDGQTFDGKTKTAIFPGDLPSKPESFFQRLESNSELLIPPINVVRFRPPQIETDEQGVKLSLPHIRLDRALDYLLGDRLA